MNLGRFFNGQGALKVAQCELMNAKAKSKTALRMIREYFGKTQTEFAALVGRSPSVIQKIEYGGRTISPDLAEIISAATNIPSELLYDSPSALQQLAQELAKHPKDELEKTLETLDLPTANVSLRHTLELLLEGAARLPASPGKLVSVGRRILCAFHKIAYQSDLIPHINGINKERGSSPTHRPLHGETYDPTNPRHREREWQYHQPQKSNPGQQAKKL